MKRKACIRRFLLCFLVTLLFGQVNPTLAGNGPSQNDSYRMVIGGTRILDILANDTLDSFEPAPGELTIIPGSEPVFGMLQIEGNVLAYISNGENTGVDSFSYRICGISGSGSICDTARVLISIESACDIDEEVLFLEDFGQGAANPGTELLPGSTTYCYENLQGSCPQVSSPENNPLAVDDGQYSILNTPSAGSEFIPGVFVWLDHPDHTEGDEEGYMLVVNAGFEPGEFYRIDGITTVPGEQYSFSAWFSNILTETVIAICGNELPINIRFQVEDSETGTTLARLNTGDIFATGTENWTQVDFNFIASSDLVNLVLINQGPGGCGNDLAIDDIVFRKCRQSVSDLSLVKQVDNTAPFPGDTLFYSITLFNDGPDPANGIAVRDLLPAGMPLPGFLDPPADLYGDTLMWTDLALQPGDSVLLAYWVVLEDILDSVEYVNIAEVMASSSLDPDSEPGNDDGDQSEDDEDRATVFPISCAVPVAVNDQYFIEDNTDRIELNVLSNDSYMGREVDISFFSLPGKGELQLGEDGIFFYTPQSFSDGMDSFTYVICVKGLVEQACCDTALVSLLFGCLLPGGISPNGDGFNDLLSFDCLPEGMFSTLELAIYNRWGVQVFQGAEGNTSWDATFRNKPLPGGTYYFVLKLEMINGNILMRKGALTVRY